MTMVDSIVRLALDTPLRNGLLVERLAARFPAAAVRDIRAAPETVAKARPGDPIEFDLLHWARQVAVRHSVKPRQGRGE